MAERLAGKVAVITGTAWSLGRTAALMFAQEGAKVVGCDVQTSRAEETVKMVRQAGGEMISLQPLDLTDEEQVKRLMQVALETYGGIDILYNNASATRFDPIEDMTYENFQFVIRNELF